MAALMDKNQARSDHGNLKFGIDSEFEQKPGDDPPEIMLKIFFCFSPGGY